MAWQVLLIYLIKLFFLDIDLPALLYYKLSFFRDCCDHACMYVRMRRRQCFLQMISNSCCLISFLSHLERTQRLGMHIRQIACPPTPPLPHPSPWIVLFSHTPASIDKAATFRYFEGKREQLNRMWKTASVFEVVIDWVRIHED